jgi:hypothetical protein
MSLNCNRKEMSTHLVSSHAALLADIMDERAARANLLTSQAQEKRRQISVYSQVARLLLAKVTYTEEERTRELLKLLKEDGERTSPWIDLGVQLADGSLLLTALIKFLAQILTLSTVPAQKLQQEKAWKLLEPNLCLVNELLVRVPSEATSVRHEEERGALVLLASFVTPTYNQGSGSHDYILALATSLIKRGASVHARSSGGFTALQHWCVHDIVKASGLVLLLDVGADLSSAQPDRDSALELLCMHRCIHVLRELSDAGWLVSADLDAPIQQLRHNLKDSPNDGDVIEMLELLAGQQQHWTQYARAAVLAELTVYEQLVPSLAELIVAYMDGSGKPFPSSSPSASSSSTSVSASVI